ncbi:poly-beta-1,6 N-acetyl-D-glucosamine export porin PgaA [Brenneria izadpanahii]|uniref:Poly-beta-1,6 N-acetyl-D-glucosamine export porin PgaA n=1 Tax=Brenneria izadpanahii TaxID=2722756 RepID=A0ABX7UTV4_9GAMM|nr:poly-beta-1,6 N-acetyl-D-glucosamine export porin PgaA [Brenneria izadpanahii]QTF07807.1 poly-beta-1,6 N-acetyl-D-glucosamine export porin PgaA [Brenneria izadpanahii]
MPLFSARLHHFYLQWNKWLISFVSLGCVGYAQASVSDYDALVVQARQGNTDAATAWLDRQSRQRLLTVNEVADWLQINGWAGNDNEVIRLWQRYRHVAVLPNRAITAAAKSYRNLRQWPQSLELWRMALKRSPNDDDALSGLVMTLSDAGQREEALHLASMRVQRAPSAAHWRELAWVQNAAGLHEEALVSISQAVQRSPYDAQLLSDYSAVLADNRISKPALAIGNQAELSPAALRQRQSDAAAELVRMAFLPSPTERERFAVADRALASYETLLTRWRAEPEAQADYRRARIDRMGALLARYRMEEVAAEYEDLRRAGDIPAYARLWAASAYLYLRQPAKAEQLYLAVQRDAPQEIRRLGEQSNLYYSMAENGRIAQAQRQARQLSRNIPYYRHLYGSPVPAPNDDWLAAQRILTQSILLRDALPQAQRKAEHLADTAPGNQGLRIDLADIYLMRGWPRRAEMELKQVEGLEPRNMYLETRQGLAALDLQEWRQADLLTDDVIARYPEDSGVQRLERLRRVHHMAELRISGGQGIKSDSPVSGSHNADIDAVLYSPPLADNWRLFSGFAFHQGEFNEGRGINRHVRGGVEFTNRNNWLEAEISGQNYGRGQKIGARLSGRHDFDDSWRIGASAERLMDRTPLRALTNGVTANGGQAYVRWRQNERREWRLTLAPGWFSDGNRRFEYSLEAKERLYSSAFLTLDFTPSLSGSRNSRSDVAYYSPRHDAALLPALTLDHLIYRHYQTEWHQVVVAGAGSYWQKGESRGAITTLGYGQRVLWNDVLDARVMVNWDKRPYDGVREQNLSLSFDLNYRF